MRTPTLRATAVALHVLLIAALSAAMLWPFSAWRVLIAAALAAPLAAALRGLKNGNRGTQRWLAALLVPYIGGLCMEVVARAGAAPLLAIALLAAVAELGVLFALSRRP